jgi:hypothetical protein
MRTFEKFFEQVRESVDSQAKRKGYTEKNIDEENRLAAIMKLLGIQVPHGIGEIIYKVTEYLKNPREVLLVKIAGWCYILWREHADTQ